MSYISLCCKHCGEVLERLMVKEQRQKPVESSVLCSACAAAAHQKRLQK